jgi:hypothetical protein
VVAGFAQIAGPLWRYERIPGRRGPRRRTIVSYRWPLQSPVGVAEIAETPRWGITAGTVTITSRITLESVT